MQACLGGERGENPGAAEVLLPTQLCLPSPCSRRAWKEWDTAQLCPTQQVTLRQVSSPFWKMGPMPTSQRCWEHPMRSYMRIHCKKQGATCLLLSTPTTVSFGSSEMKMLILWACWHPDPKPPPRKTYRGEGTFTISKCCWRAAPTSDPLIITD